MIQNILVVCVGNICRSPMAAALLKTRLPGVEVVSAGIGALIGQPADPHVLSLLDGCGVDASAHRAQQLTERLCSGAQLILVMEQVHKDHIERLYPVARGKVFRLGSHDRHDIFDPYGQSRERFDDCYALIAPAVDKWASSVAKLA